MWHHATRPFRTRQSALLLLRIKGGVLAVAMRLRHDRSPFFLVSSLTSSPNGLPLSSPGCLLTAFPLTKSPASETLPRLPPRLVSSSSFPVGVTLRPGSRALLRGDSSPSVSRVSAGALDLRWGPQEPALVASGKASPHASCSGASRDSSPVDTGA